MDNLQERNFGKWNSWEWPSISIELAKLSLEDRYMFKPPGGESWQEMETRLKRALRDIAALQHDTVAVMTHAGPLRVILTMLKIKTRAASVNYVPSLGKCLVEQFDPSTT